MNKKLETIRVGRRAYRVQVEPDESTGGYVATVAGLPGCITDGDSIREVLENATDAVRGWLDAQAFLKRKGIAVPTVAADRGE